MAMKKLEVCSVTPPLGSPTDMNLALTFFDLLWLRFPPVELLCFYEAPHPETDFSHSILPKLKHSLSLTLQHYLPVAGNLIWPPSSPSPIIRYKKGDGILLTVAQSDDDFHHLSTNLLRETEIFHPFIANIAASNSQVPVMAVKVTFFPNKGFCIGLTVHHALCDGNAFIMFMKSWASITKLGHENGGLKPEFTPLFDKKKVRERYPQLEELYISEFLKQKGVVNPKSLAFSKFESPPDRVRGTFQLSGSDVKLLNRFVHARLAGNYTDKEINQDFDYISAFTVTFAYLIVCLVKAKGQTGNQVNYSLVVDYRARLEPPLPANYFGNCIGFPGGYVDREEIMGEDGIIVVVDAINKTRRSLHDGVLKEAEAWLILDMLKEEAGEETTNISLAGSSRLECYSLDFGWGRPRKVDITSIDKTRAISFIEGRDGGGGIEMELSLTKHEMERFASEFAQGLSKMKHISAAL